MGRGLSGGMPPPELPDQAHDLERVIGGAKARRTRDLLTLGQLRGHAGRIDDGERGIGSAGRADERKPLGSISGIDVCHQSADTPTLEQVEGLGVCAREGHMKP